MGVAEQAGTEERAPAILVKLAKDLEGATSVVSDLEAKLKIAKAREAAAEKKLVDEMTTQGLKSFKAEGLGGYRTEAVVYPNVKDKELLNAFVQKRKSLAFLYTVSVHGGKLKAYVKELMQQGKPIPPGIDPFVTTEIRRFSTARREA